MCTGPDVTRQWGWLSSTLPAFINGYDLPALNAPEPRQQSALTMAEEDDARIRILQSLRGKICKSDWRADVFRLTQAGGKRLVREASGERGSRRGAACHQQCGGRGGSSSRSAAWWLTSS